MAAKGGKKRTYRKKAAKKVKRTMKRTRGRKGKKH